MKPAPAPARAGRAAGGDRGADPARRGGGLARPRRPARARHCRRHARADRRRALPRQPLVGPDGLRARERGGGARRRRHGRRGERRPAARRARDVRRRRDRRRAAGRVRRRVRAGRRAAHGGGRRRLPPGPQLRGQAQEDDRRGAHARRARAHAGHPHRPRGRAPPDQTLVGFAAEHGDGALEYGREKLARKGLDAVVVNDVSRKDIGFDAADNEVTILTTEGEAHIARASKSQIARAVLDAVVALRARSTAPAPSSPPGRRLNRDERGTLVPTSGARPVRPDPERALTTGWSCR